LPPESFVDARRNGAPLNKRIHQTDPCEINQSGKAEMENIHDRFHPIFVF
jgi:hypothetical protein